MNGLPRLTGHYEEDWKNAEQAYSNAWADWLDTLTKEEEHVPLPRAEDVNQGVVRIVAAELRGETVGPYMPPNPPVNTEIFKKLAKLCRKYATHELWAYADHLHRKGIPPSQIVSELEEHAKATIEDVRRRKWNDNVERISDCFECRSLAEEVWRSVVRGVEGILREIIEPEICSGWTWQSTSTHVSNSQDSTTAAAGGLRQPEQTGETAPKSEESAPPSAGPHEPAAGNASDDHQREVTVLRGRRCDPLLWQHFSDQRTPKTSSYRELPLRSFVSLSVPKDRTNRDVVEQIAEESHIPIESLCDDLDQPVFSRGQAIFGFAGDEFDQIADNYDNMQWWISDAGLNMAIVSPTKPSRTVPTLDELVEITPRRTLPKARKTNSERLTEYKVLKQIRTHEMVAEHLGLERSVYFDLKAGRNVSEETYIKAALAIGCSADDLKP